MVVSEQLHFNAIFGQGQSPWYSFMMSKGEQQIRP
jgi:hypothetical protein